MKVKVAQWGNSLGVRLPKAAAESAGVIAGSELELTVEGGGFRLRAVRKTSKQLLDEMLSEIERLGLKSETVEWGPDVGSEIIDDDYSRGLIVEGPDGAPERNDDSGSTDRAGKNHGRARRR
jgi:antitoxin MazE